MPQTKDQSEHTILQCFDRLLTICQCDEGKPGCRKCAQIHAQCPGYPFQVQLQLLPNLRPSTEDANSKTRPPGPNLPALQSVTTDEKPPVHSLNIQDARAWHQTKVEKTTPRRDLTQLAPVHGSISYPPRYDIKHQSLCFFLNLFCFQAGRLYSFPVLDFLPEMLQHADPHSCVFQAGLAVSRMTLADRYSGKDVRLQTGREYGHALSLANATIRDTAASIQDETVIAVWLLGLYEVGPLNTLSDLGSHSV